MNLERLLRTAEHDPGAAIEGARLAERAGDFEMVARFACHLDLTSREAHTLTYRLIKSGHAWEIRGGRGVRYNLLSKQWATDVLCGVRWWHISHDVGKGDERPCETFDLYVWSKVDTDKWVSRFATLGLSEGLMRSFAVRCAEVALDYVYSPKVHDLCVEVLAFARQIESGELTYKEAQPIWSQYFERFNSKDKEFDALKTPQARKWYSDCPDYWAFEAVSGAAYAPIAWKRPRITASAAAISAHNGATHAVAWHYNRTLSEPRLPGPVMAEATHKDLADMWLGMLLGGEPLDASHEIPNPRKS